MFSYCTIDVKKEFFRSYCLSLYCCSLWSNYRKETYRKLTVAFNNIQRCKVLMGRSHHDNKHESQQSSDMENNQNAFQ